MQIFRNFEPRIYQETILSSCITKNCLVVLPTGIGKTAIAMMLACARLRTHADSKVLVLAPTRPLVNQHLETFSEKISPEFIHRDEMVSFTGAVAAEKRQELWKDAKIIFSTPQGLENDIVSERVTLENISLIVFDEAHRATGDYSYVWIADRYRKQAKSDYERILALTASPGTDQESIDEVCKNLFVEKIEVRDRESPDVKPYVQDVKFNWVDVDLPASFKEVLDILNRLYKDGLKRIERILGELNKNSRHISKKDLLQIQAQLQGRIASGETTPEIFNSVSDTAQLLKLQHGIELLETQGVNAAWAYMDELWRQGISKKTKAAAKLASDPDFKIAIAKLMTLFESEFEHPKIPKLLEILNRQFERNPDSKVIVFNNYRDSISSLHAKISSSCLQKSSDGRNLIRPAIFVGQAKKKGLGNTQKEQLKLIHDLREGVHNVMIMSSVGEEGLDIPAVDLVIFYEPVPSAIRQIQRAGRTGRQAMGKVIVLCAKGTRDIAYRWSTQNKQKRMYEVLEKSDKMLNAENGKDENNNISMDLDASFEDSAGIIIEDKESQLTLNDSVNKVIKIIVDNREKSNRIVKQLIDFGCKIRLEQLDVGDYVLDENTGVEFKTKKDFVDSIVDGRVFEQAAALSRAYTKPLFVIQGSEDLYSIRNVHKNAIIGALSTLATGFRIPVIFTKDSDETSDFFLSIAKRQEKDLANFSLHASKPKDPNTLQEYIVGSFPNIGPSAAKNILTHFKTIRKFANARKEELSEVDMIGKGKAESILEMFDREYENK